MYLKIHNGNRKTKNRGQIFPSYHDIKQTGFCVYGIIKLLFNNIIMAENKKLYLSLMSEIIEKAGIVFGLDIAILKGQKVAGLIIDGNRKVVGAGGYAADALQELINEYFGLSGAATQIFLDEVMKKYPEVSLKR